MITRATRAGAILLGAVLLSGCATTYRPRPPGRAIPAGVFHIVGSGQTLWGLARAYDIDLDLLMRTNALSDPAQLEVGQKLFIPRARKVLEIEPHKPPIGKKPMKVKWRTITLHHSATRKGNAEIFDRYHRRRGMGGLVYHFVIGNGTGSGDGQIEVGWRWIKQREANRAGDINICLVGNFNTQKVSERQFASLVRLIRLLRQQYGIPLTLIRRHKDLKGETTECPGKHFPFWRLRRELQR